MQINTYSGGRFDPDDIKNSDFRIEDIAHALSLQCRFAGHIPEFYSVAEHSVFVSYYSNDFLAGLLHDASEAYLMDIPTPVKRSKIMIGYSILENDVMKEIFHRFNLDYPYNSDVHKADQRVLRTEAEYFGLLDETWEVYNLKNIDHGIGPLKPEYAEKLFIKRYKEITNGSILG